MKSRIAVVCFSCTLTAFACGSGDEVAPATDAGVALGDASVIGLDAGTEAATEPADASSDGDAASKPRDRFVTKVVSFTPGPCSGFGAAELPDIVLGPPEGAGDQSGSLDVVSLGIGGEIILSFEPNAIVDGPGDDFVVFENAFFAAGNPAEPAADLGEVSVSDDGVTWKTYACAPGPNAPYTPCAGWTPVRSSSRNGISPFDPARAGGEAYDLASVGLSRARFVRIRDMGTSACPDAGPKPTNLGFDLDAIAILNPAQP